MWNKQQIQQIQRFTHNLDALFSCDDIEEYELIQQDVYSDFSEILEYIDNA